MPLLATKYSGTVPFDSADAFRFPQGLPAFDDEKSFVLLNVPGKHPLVFLQSSRRPELCFLALPILVIDPKYELSVSFEDLTALELGTHRQPRIGPEVLVLALLSIRDRHPATANLMAPVVLNLTNRLGVQAVRCDFRHSHQHALAGLARGEAC